MEEKINNQKIFSYVPSLIARLILDSFLQDKDIFTEGTETESKIINSKRKRSTLNFINATSVNINSNMFPNIHRLQNTIIMNIKLKGFQKLISILSFKDPQDVKEKMFSEYLSVITPKILLKISRIIEKNGGEILKYNDYEFTTIWNIPLKKKEYKMQRIKKFYAKYAMITAIEIMKFVDETEISCGVKLKISIGIGFGKTIIGFFGGERKRSDIIVMGKAIESAEICLYYGLTHEIIISEEMNNLFKGSAEISTKKICNDDKKSINIYSLKVYNEYLLKNFIGFRKMKLKNNKIIMSKKVYENLANKVYFFSSILPQGLIKHFDLGEDQNLKEISVVTIATIHIFFNFENYTNYTVLQNLILDIQKATYLTFGSLLFMSKTYTGLLLRCVWGMDPGSFLDDTARAISTAFILGKLTKYYNIKIGIGIATGSCYCGLIPLQGDKKQFTLLGKKVNISRILADSAFERVLEKDDIKYIIYCDQLTMIQSQKWYRHVYISQIKVYLNQDSDLDYETNDDFFLGINKNKLFPKKLSKNLGTIKNNQKINFITEYPDDYNNNVTKLNNNIKNKRRGKHENKTKNLIETTRILKLNPVNDEYRPCLTEPDEKTESEDSSYLLVTEIYAPIEKEEYFIPNKYDPFPLLRSHLNNSFSSNNKFYINNQIENYSNNDMEIDLNLIFPNNKKKNNNNNNNNGSSPNTFKEKIVEINAHIESLKIFQKSVKVIGNNKEIEAMLKIMRTVIEKNSRQFFLVKGPLGIGKTLFVRKVLNDFLNENERLSKIHFFEEEFIFCNLVNPISIVLPYNTLSFIFRKIFLHLKRLNKIKNIYDISQKLRLDSDDLKNISFILSIGKSDIDLKTEFEKINLNVKTTLKVSEIFQSTKFSRFNTQQNFSVVAKLEGPYKFEDIIKLNSFFYEMIIIYKEYLNNKYTNIPLILVLDDIHSSDEYAIEFLNFIFSKDRKLNPLMVIFMEQIPYNKNFRPLKHRILEVFFMLFEENNIAITDPEKIITIELTPFNEKSYIHKILLSNFVEMIFFLYKSNIEKIDDKILDFLLMKSFNGVPLLCITLFESLLKSKKYIKKVGNDLLITNDLIDDNILFDWSDILIPYVYEKIC